MIKNLCSKVVYDFVDLLNEIETNEFKNYGNLLTHSFNKSYYKLDNNDNEYVVEITLPGYTKEDVQVKFEKDYLRLIHKETEEKKNSYWVKDFDQKIFVGNDVDTEKISGKLENGILKIVLPKREDSKSKNIEL